MNRYLLVGYLTRDLIPEGGFRFGGAVLYAGLTVRRLGFTTHILTSAAESREELEHLFPELFWHLCPARQTTVFENREGPSGRMQRVWARAGRIDPRAVPDLPLEIEILHLAPVLDEVPPHGDFLQGLKYRMLVANPQGWFREVTPQGTVRPRVPDLTACPRFEALVVSEEDLAADLPGLLSLLRQKTRYLVLTRGAEGASFFHGSEERFLPARRVKAVDTTGAGDILAGAFFALLSGGENPLQALEKAMEMAAIGVTRPGLAGVPTYREIENLLGRPS